MAEIEKAIKQLEEYIEEYVCYKQDICSDGFCKENKCSAQNAIQTIRKLQSNAKQEAISELINTSSFNQGYVCGVHDTEMKAKKQESEEVCEWRIVDRPNGFPIFNTSCGAIRLACAKGIDIYCNACGRKIKVVSE